MRYRLASREIVSRLISSLAVGTLANPVLFFNDLFEPLRREIVLRPLSCFGYLQYASSTTASIRTPFARFYSLRGSTKRIAQRPLLSRIDFIPLPPANLAYSLSPSFSLSSSLHALNTSSPLCGRSLKGIGLSFRLLFVFPRTKLFPPSASRIPISLSRSNYLWQTPKLIAEESRCGGSGGDSTINFRFIYLRDCTTQDVLLT